jgi:hypothetical protein
MYDIISRPEFSISDHSCLSFQLLLSGTVPATKVTRRILHSNVLQESTGPLWADLRAIIQAVGCIEIPVWAVTQVVGAHMGPATLPA